MNLRYSNLVAAVVSVAAYTQVNASLITGEISFSGSATLDQNLATATSIVEFKNVTVGHDSQTGSYKTGTDGDFVNFSPFSFQSGGSLLLTPNPVTVWSFQAAGTTYSFKMNSLTSYTVSGNQSLNVVSIEGSGMASITGYEDTPGHFDLTLLGHNSHVVFVAQNSPIPEPSTCAMVSGLGLVSFGLIRRCRS